MNDKREQGQYFCWNFNIKYLKVWFGIKFFKACGAIIKLLLYFQYHVSVCAQPHNPRNAFELTIYLNDCPHYLECTPWTLRTNWCNYQRIWPRNYFTSFKIFL